MKLKKFSKNTKTEDLVKALSIYVQNIDHEALTSTNEILHCLDNYNDTSPNDFYLFGIYNDTDHVVGFLQFVHFKKGKILFIDYIVLGTISRSKGSFQEVIELLKVFLIKNKIDFDYIICEVEDNQGKTSLIRLYKMLGFKKFDIPYVQPYISNNFDLELLDESFNQPYALMVYTDKTEVDKYEFLRILNVIYYDHYKKWYEMFLTDNEMLIYTYHIDVMKANLIGHLEKVGIVTIK
jgi:hypothetical protein